MKRFLSRLGSSPQGTEGHAERVVAPQAVPVEDRDVELPTSSLRIGIDFGTSTTQVAIHLAGQEPRLLPLERLSDSMPSYFAIDESGRRWFGREAANLSVSVHSIKTKLRDDVPLTELEGMRPSDVALAMLRETVRRTLALLVAQRLVPARLDRLEVATNLGCTPMFNLEQRLRLRDIAEEAGIDVKLASLIEEPVAAAYEVMLSGLFVDGRFLIVDMGGGTLDIAVVRISEDATRFELFASGGYERGGDKFTEVIATSLRGMVAEAAGGAALSRADETLLWRRAEQAKVTLSLVSTATVDLGGIAGLPPTPMLLDQTWFEKATAGLRVYVKADVTNIYRLSRLVLDRGGKYDTHPGTVDFHEPQKGAVLRLTQVGLADDGLEHIDFVVLVGGATNMPMISKLFGDIFGSRMLEPEIVGLDRSAVVALGLARPKPVEMTSLRYPSWGVSLEFRTPEGIQERPVYEPYAPSFKVERDSTAEHEYRVSVPEASSALRVVFRPIGDRQAVVWPFDPLPPGATTLTFTMDLFGRFGVLAANGDQVLAPDAKDRVVPWRPTESDSLAEWLPPWKTTNPWVDLPTWDLVNNR